MNEKIYQFTNVADSTMLNIISSQLDQQITAPMARGWRFWAQFLGFGYMNNMAFLETAVQDAEKKAKNDSDYSI